ncbi:MAG TPA: tannase/feruloyl esterase family alpha/beta hydrolase [Hyphomonadaceae bacterium]|nr:tannase/feruloyl esterase family alpha/beta hydrolase [Hyphomonadaceae bacterium]
MLRLSVAAGLLALAAAAAGTAQAQVACESMKGFQAPDVRITAASATPNPVPLCKVDGVIGKEINFTVWLPEAWNGKFVMGGQGGFAGRVESQALQMQALQKGYAVAGTDTGHSSQGAADGAWAMGDIERILNYAHGAIHRVTETSKAIVKARYGRTLEKSYFAGCSNGGREALMSAERYPNDFDGIVAGAPAINFQAITAGFATITQKMYPDPAKLDTPTLDKPARDLLAKAVLDKCDELDGLKDGIMTDPRKCTFDVKTLACKGGKKDACLNPAQIAAVDAITKGPMLNGKSVGFAYPYGGEVNDAGWGTWLAGRKDGVGKGVPSLAYGFSGDFMRYFLKQDPTWNHNQLNLATLPKEMEYLQKTLSPTDPDLSAYRKHGGKLLIYHGWSDPALSPLMSIDYVDQVYAKDASAKGDVRLFMLPGVLHCQGGPGPDRVDALDIIDKWVHGGAAPDEVTTAFGSGGARKACAYPKAASYKGAGDGKSPDQFECK